MQEAPMSNVPQPDGTPKSIPIGLVRAAALETGYDRIVVIGMQSDGPHSSFKCHREDEVQGGKAYLDTLTQARDLLEGAIERWEKMNPPEGGVSMR